MASQIALHEAAHAVVAVYLGVSFIRVVKVGVYETDKATGKTLYLPPGLTNATGPAPQMRICALAGCMADVIDGTEPWARSVLPGDSTYVIVRRLLGKRYGLDLKCYHENQPVLSENIEDADLALAQEYVNLLMPKIVEVGELLDCSIQLSHRQVKEICNFQSS